MSGKVGLKFWLNPSLFDHIPSLNSALEDLDSLLFRATRETGSVPVDIMKTRVSTAVTALDK